MLLLAVTAAAVVVLPAAQASPGTLDPYFNDPGGTGFEDFTSQVAFNFTGLPETIGGQNVGPVDGSTVDFGSGNGGGGTLDALVDAGSDDGFLPPVAGASSILSKVVLPAVAGVAAFDFGYNVTRGAEHILFGFSAPSLGNLLSGSWSGSYAFTGTGTEWLPANVPTYCSVTGESACYVLYEIGSTGSGDCGADGGGHTTAYLFNGTDGSGGEAPCQAWAAAAYAASVAMQTRLGSAVKLAEVGTDNSSCSYYVVPCYATVIGASEMRSQMHLKTARASTSSDLSNYPVVNFTPPSTIPNSQVSAAQTLCNTESACATYINHWKFPSTYPDDPFSDVFTMPSDLPGDTPSAADSELAGLGWTGTSSSVEVPFPYGDDLTKPAGAVVTTSPGAGVEVSKTADVTYNVNANPLPLEVLQPRIGETYDAYTARLTAAGWLGTSVRVDLADSYADTTLGPDAVARVTIPTYDPASKTDVDTLTLTPTTWPVTTPRIKPDETITIDVNPASVPTPAHVGDPWTTTPPGGSPEPVNPPTPTPSTSCPCTVRAVDLSPLTSLDFGTHFPFGIVTWVGGVIGSITTAGDGACPSLDWTIPAVGALIAAKTVHMTPCVSVGSWNTADTLSWWRTIVTILMWCTTVFVLGRRLVYGKRAEVYDGDGDDD